MKKEEFLAMSLPYSLSAIAQNRVVVINGINYEKELPIIWDSVNKVNSNFKGIAGFGILPICRQLSDLTKPIEHKGEKFVPMVELAKIEGLFDIEINPECSGVFSNNRQISFLFRDCSFKKGKINYNENDWVEDFEIVKQFELFLKLIEWHFDIAGLIEKGEAIDVNTLTENPYK